MLEKFQKLFGPNPPRTGARRSNADMDPMEFEAEDEALRKQVARMRNRRRAIGLAAIAAAVAVVAPAVFEPNDMYAERGAKLEIPSLEDETASKVVQLNRPAKQTKALASDIATAELPAEQSLRSENPVDARAKAVDVPAIASEQSKPAVTPGKNKLKEENLSQAVAQEPLRAVTKGRYFIQVVATTRKEAAEKMAEDLRKLGLPTYTEIVRRRGSDLWRVRVGRFATQEDAQRAMDILALNAVSNGGVNTEDK